MIWRFRTGGQWREMPSEFGAWSTVHNRFRHVEGRRGLRGPAGGLDRGGREAGRGASVAGQRGFHHRPSPPRQRRDAPRPRHARRPGEGCGGGGEGPTRGAARRQPAVHPRTGEGPRSRALRSPPHLARRGRRRQGPGILNGSARAHEGQLPPTFTSHQAYSSHGNRAHSPGRRHHRLNPARVAHVGRIPQSPVRTVPGIPEPVRDAIARREAESDNTDKGARKTTAPRASCYPVGFDTHELRGKPHLHASQARRSPARVDDLELTPTEIDGAAATKGAGVTVTAPLASRRSTPGDAPIVERLRWAVRVNAEAARARCALGHYGGYRPEEQVFPGQGYLPV